MKNKVLEHIKAGLVVSGTLAGNKRLIISQKYFNGIEKAFLPQVIKKPFKKRIWK